MFANRFTVARVHNQFREEFDATSTVVAEQLRAAGLSAPWGQRAIVVTAIYTPFPHDDGTAVTWGDLFAESTTSEAWEKLIQDTFVPGVSM